MKKQFAFTILTALSLAGTSQAIFENSNTTTLLSLGLTSQKIKQELDELNSKAKGYTPLIMDCYNLYLKYNAKLSSLSLYYRNRFLKKIKQEELNQIISIEAEFYSKLYKAYSEL